MNRLICFALKEEAAPFQKIAAARPGTALLIVGIGRKNAESCVRNFLPDINPGLVLTCGFAGALDADLKLGDVVFEIAPDDDPLAELADALAAAGARPGKFFCADRVATTIAEKEKLRAETGADAVEMESAAIHAVCRERGVPCATVRVISDTAGEDLPLDFNALAKPDRSLDFGKLAWKIVRSPGKVAALLELRKKTNFAAARLAAVLAQVTSA